MEVIGLRCRRLERAVFSLTAVDVCMRAITKTNDSVRRPAMSLNAKSLDHH